jgi:hypothetical protein
MSAEGKCKSIITRGINKGKICGTITRYCTTDAHKLDNNSVNLCRDDTIASISSTIDIQPFIDLGYDIDRAKELANELFVKKQKEALKKIEENIMYIKSLPRICENSKIFADRLYESFSSNEEKISFLKECFDMMEIGAVKMIDRVYNTTGLTKGTYPFVLYPGRNVKWITPEGTESTDYYKFSEKLRYGILQIYADYANIVNTYINDFCNRVRPYISTEHPIENAINAEQYLGNALLMRNMLTPSDVYGSDGKLVRNTKTDVNCKMEKIIDIFRKTHF